MPLTAMPSEQTAEVLGLTIPPDIAAVSTARLFAAAVARGLGLGDDEIEDLRLAVSEGASNAVRIHQSAGVNQPIQVRITPSAQRVDVEIIDAGPGFESDSSPPRVDGDEGHLGITVIRALYPDAEFTSNPAGGMTLRFRLERPRALGVLRS